MSSSKKKPAKAKAKTTSKDDGAAGETPKKKTSPRQIAIPGTEEKKIKELDDAAMAYVKERDERIALSRKEKTAKDALIAAMKKHGKNVYRDPDAAPPYTVTLTEGKDKIKVERDGSEDDSNDSE